MLFLCLHRKSIKLKMYMYNKADEEEFLTQFCREIAHVQGMRKMNQMHKSM